MSEGSSVLLSCLSTGLRSCLSDLTLPVLSRCCLVRWGSVDVCHRSDLLVHGAPALACNVWREGGLEPRSSPVSHPSHRSGSFGDRGDWLLFNFLCVLVVLLFSVLFFFVLVVVLFLSVVLLLLNIASASSSSPAPSDSASPSSYKPRAGGSCFLSPLCGRRSSLRSWVY